MKRKYHDQVGLSRPVCVVGFLIFLALVGGLAAWRLSSKSTPATKQTATNVNPADYTINLTFPAYIQGVTEKTVTPPSGAKTPLAVVTSLEQTEFTTLANKCLGLPATTEQSFANLVKVKGQRKGLSQPLAQIGGYNIVNLGASIPSPIKCKDESTRQKLTTLNAQLNDALSQAIKNLK